MIGRLVLFGATGDLAGRYLLPALAALRAAGRLPAGFEVVGTGRRPLDDEAFRRAAAGDLAHHASDVPGDVRHALVRDLRHRPVDLDDPVSVARAVGDDRRPVVAYLALPPAVYATAIGALATVGLPEGSRVALEKPFGEDLASAVELNRLLSTVAGVAGEGAVFRVDHVLGLAMVQNLLAMRLVNRVVDAVWSGAHIERVEILWEEVLGLEGRGGYLDRAGALRDMIQNHLLQILCLAAMEPPAGAGEQALRDRKVELLRAVRTVSPDETGWRTRRARYTAGRLASGEHVPAYVDEDGVDPARASETFAEVVLDVGSERWAGTRFLLRAAKALDRHRKQLVVRFRPVAHSPVAHWPGARETGSGEAGGIPAPRNELRIGLDGPDDIALHLTGGALGAAADIVPLALTAPPPPAALPAYGHVLLDILEGGCRLSIRGDEAQESWRVVTPSSRRGPPGGCRWRSTRPGRPARRPAEGSAAAPPAPGAAGDATSPLERRVVGGLRWGDGAQLSGAGLGGGPGLVGLDPGEHHDVGDHHLGRQQGGRSTRRLHLTGQAARHLVGAVHRCLAGPAVTGPVGERGERARQVAHERGQHAALGGVRGHGRACQQDAAAPEQVEVAGVLVLGHHRRHERPPDHRVAHDPLAGPPQPPQLCQVVAHVAQAVGRPVGQAVVAALEASALSASPSAMPASALPSARRTRVTGSGENSTWVNTRATPAPISASSRRSTPASPSATTTVRMALAAAWLSTSRLPGRAWATVRAANTASARLPGPPPRTATVTSPAPMPTTTPCTRRTAVRPRSPREAFSAIAAEIGAKNGSAWSPICLAIIQAMAAAAVVWSSGHISAAHRRRWCATPVPGMSLLLLGLLDGWRRGVQGRADLGDIDRSSSPDQEVRACGPSA